MKIDVGKEYKSNISHINPVGGSLSQEVWKIVTTHSEGGTLRYVGRRLEQDGKVMLREFDQDGKDGLTNSGKPRQLLPNTRTVEMWGITRKESIYDTAFFQCSQALTPYPNTEEG